MAKNFDELAQPIINDPVRAVRVERFVVEALEQVVTLEGSEQDEAAEDLVDQRELELARAENEFLAWEEVKADLGLA